MARSNSISIFPASSEFGYAQDQTFVDASGTLLPMQGAKPGLGGRRVMLPPAGMNLAAYNAYVEERKAREAEANKRINRRAGNPAIFNRGTLLGGNDTPSGIGDDRGMMFNSTMLGG